MKSGILILMMALAGIGVSIDGAPVEFGDQEPANIEGRTLVPVRAVFEALDFVVTWNPESQVVGLDRPGSSILIWIGQNRFYYNTEARPLEVAAQIIGGSTMLPIRALVEAVGYDVGWDAATSTVLITTQNATQTPPPAAQTTDISQLEREIFALVNAQRASGGLPSLVRNEALYTLSRGHTDDMIVNNLTSGTGSDGLNIARRLERSTQPMAQGRGHAFRFTAHPDEITTELIFERIMSIDSRRDHINHALVTDVGLAIGIRMDSPTRAMIFITQKFGTPTITDHREFERQVLELINAERAAHGLAPLALNEQASAVLHQRLANDRSAGTANLEITRRNFGSRTAMNNESPQGAVDFFMGVAEHRAQILRPDVISAGIAQGISFFETDYRLQDNYRFTVTVAFATATEIAAVANPMHFQNALDSGLIPRSAITLRDRQQTPAERAAWIAEYQSMGGPSDFERAILAEINRVRAERGLNSLSWDNELGMASRYFAQLIVDLDFQRRSVHIADEPVHGFGPYGGSNGVARSFGVDNRRGANASWLSIGTPAMIVEQWMNSPGHRANLLRSGITHAGLGSAEGGFEQHGGIHYFMSR
ncbi:MAG: CAP domain-containing protein [Clostridiales bacterium]|nr:CAP domain-containing protein [Clostridiales bacterium]